MYKITNIKELGTEYTVTDEQGKVLHTIQIIPHSEILDAALGPYKDEFGSFDTYLKKSIEVMTGFESIDPLRVLWYTTYDEEVILADVIQYAVQNGYNKIILEHMEELDDLE